MNTQPQHAVQHKHLRRTPGTLRRRKTRTTPPASAGRLNTTGVTVIWVLTALVVVACATATFMFFGGKQLELRGKDEGYRLALNTPQPDGKPPVLDNTLRIPNQRFVDMVMQHPTDHQFSGGNVTNIMVDGWQTSHGSIGFAEAVVTFCHPHNQDDPQPVLFRVTLETSNNMVAEPAWSITSITTTGEHCQQEGEPAP